MSNVLATILAVLAATLLLSLWGICLYGVITHNIDLLETGMVISGLTVLICLAGMLLTSHISE